MNQYAILNHRKRALIALIHSVAFALLAAYQLAAAQPPKALVAAQRGHLAGPLAMAVIYSIVSAVLCLLAKFSRPPLERLYFIFCAISASTGLMRVIFGDSSFRVGALIRVAMLLGAVATGLIILRDHSAANFPQQGSLAKSKVFHH